MAEERRASGLATAVQAIGPGAVSAPPAQLPLIPSDGGMPEDPAANKIAPARGAGRPPGAKNKRTEEWVEFILGRYRSPLVVLAEVYSRSVTDLAQELSCKRLDAFKMQLEAARILAPYLHQQQPQAVRIDGKGILQLVINPFAGGDPMAEEEGAETIVTIIDQKSEKSEG